MSEEWRPVRDFEGFYSVSNKGRIRRDAPAHGAVVGRILTPGIRNGYPYVNLHRGDQPVKMYVHALVAHAFIRERQAKEEVNHIDGDKRNAQFTNLEYVSRGANMRHANRIGLAPVREHRHNAKLTRAAAEEIRRLSGALSQQELAERFRVHRSTICDVLRGRTWDEFPDAQRRGPAPEPRG